MKARSLWVLGAFLLLGWNGTVRAQKFNDSHLDARVSDQTKRTEKTKINNSRQGKGELEKFENTYAAELNNTSLAEAISGLTLRLIAFYMPYDFNGKDDGHEADKIQIRDKINLQPGEVKRITFDPETYETGSAVKAVASGSLVSVTETHFGVEYAGVVLEIYQDGKLIGVRYDGNAKSRKAYEGWVAKKGYWKATEEKPKETPIPAPVQPTVITPAESGPADPFVPR